MDERVAASLPETTAEAQEGIGQNVKVIAYVREDVHLAAVRAAGSQDREILVTIQAVGSILYGLTSQGRLFVFDTGVSMLEEDDPDLQRERGWHLAADQELEP